MGKKYTEVKTNYMKSRVYYITTFLSSCDIGSPIT